MTTIQPFGDRILIKIVEQPQQTPGGLYLPDTSREGPGEGVIVAIGEGSPLQEKLSVGDQILYQKFQARMSSWQTDHTSCSVNLTSLAVSSSLINSPPLPALAVRQ